MCSSGTAEPTRRYILRAGLLHGVIMARRAEVSRKTRETEVDIRLDIDGNGRFDVHLPDAFMKHMVETFARYAQFDLMLRAKGDIPHHVFEDTAIAMGACVRRAMGTSPVERVSFAVVPMDDALVRVAVDISDRGYVSILGLEDEMAVHFLRSFALEVRMNLHVGVLTPGERHHVVEAGFKALGIAMRGALVERGSGISTKGTPTWRRGT